MEEQLTLWSDDYLKQFDFRSWREWLADLVDTFGHCSQ